MRSRFLKVLGVVAALSLATTFSVFATSFVTSTVIPATPDIQMYFAVHGVDQTLKNMVWTELNNEYALSGNPPGSVSMILGTTTFTLSGNDIGYGSSASDLQVASAPTATQNAG